MQPGRSLSVVTPHSRRREYELHIPWKTLCELTSVHLLLSLLSLLTLGNAARQKHFSFPKNSGLSLSPAPSKMHFFAHSSLSSHLPPQVKIQSGKNHQWMLNLRENFADQQEVCIVSESSHRVPIDWKGEKILIMQWKTWGKHWLGFKISTRDRWPSPVQ